jgi:hypothetical protein
VSRRHRSSSSFFLQRTRPCMSTPRRARARFLKQRLRSPRSSRAHGEDECEGAEGCGSDGWSRVVSGCADGRREDEQCAGAVQGAEVEVRGGESRRRGDRDQVLGAVGAAREGSVVGRRCGQARGHLHPHQQTSTSK